MPALHIAATTRKRQSAGNAEIDSADRRDIGKTERIARKKFVFGQLFVDLLEKPAEAKFAADFHGGDPGAGGTR